MISFALSYDAAKYLEISREWKLHRNQLTINYQVYLETNYQNGKCPCMHKTGTADVNNKAQTKKNILYQ